MENILSVTAPIYLLMAVGLAAVRLGWMRPTDMRVMGQFVARFCVPALLFRAISRQPINDVLHGDYLAVYAGGSLLALGAVTLFALRVRGRPLSLAAMPMLSIYPVLAQRHGQERFCAAALLVTTVLSFFMISAFIGAIPAHWLGER